MFILTQWNLDKSIISFGDGLSSFNADMKELGKSVVSFDPIDAFSSTDLPLGIVEVKPILMEQICRNVENFVCLKIKDLAGLEHRCLSAMVHFLQDFESGKGENR